MEAISDRILIKADEGNDYTLPDFLPTTGTVESSNTNVVKQGDKVVFQKGNHPTHEGLIIIREEQLYAKIL